jgi:putative ABC exporter
MDRALWLLLWLRWTSWVRRLRRSLKSVKGMLLVGLGGGMILLWLASFVIQQFLPLQERRPPPLEEVRLYGPLILLGYCLLSSAFASGERVVHFSPAEVNFLFPGPFTRRQVLLYKIIGTLLVSQLTALFLMFVLLQYSTSLLSSLVAVSLAMGFVQLFAMALALMASVVGAKAYNRRRRVVLAVVGVILVAGLVLEARSTGAADFAELFRALATSPIVRALLTPLSWFVDAFTAESAWQLLTGAVLSLLVDLALLALVLGLDAHYLEAAAAASEKMYARLQRLRTGGGAAAWGALGEKARFSLPSLPSWGGIGPIAWRQMVSALRGIKGLVIVLIILGLMVGMPMFFTAQGAAGERADGDGTRLDDHSGAATARIALASGLISVSVFMLPMMLTFDFRGDVDRIDILKSLPLQAWQLAIGQLLTPVLMTAIIQVLLLAMWQAIWGGMELLLLGAVCFALPVNFLLFGIENLVFLWFPTRMATATPGDFQAMGRYMLLFMLKMVVLAVTVGLASAVGGFAYAITDDYYVAGAACWPVIVGMGSAFVPLIAHAFRRFDVARDTPP